MTRIQPPVFSGFTARRTWERTAARLLQSWFTPKTIKNITYNSLKRLIDIFGSLVLLAFASPPMLIISIAIRLSSPGPAIYCQKRLTDGGKTFTIFKFRSMASDAEACSGAVWAGTSGTQGSGRA